MPGIDYRRLRTEISMRQVLELIGLESGVRRGDQQRCCCPLSACRQRADRTFSVDLGRGIFRCFACRTGGNQLDLWALHHHLPLHAAAQSLCHATRTSIPWLASQQG